MIKQSTLKTDTASYLDSLLAIGRYSVSLDELEEHIPKSLSAIRADLARLIKAHRVVSLRDRFYLLLTPEHRQKGMLPYAYYIHDLMSWLERPYYISLLSAASLHGATSQAVQSVFVTSIKPALRDIRKSTVNIHFQVNSRFPTHGILQMKSPGGYINVSSAELTALDLLKYPDSGGGIYQIVSIIRELSDMMNTDLLYDVISDGQPTVILQRLGLILDRYSNRTDLLPLIRAELAGRDVRRTLLSPAEPDMTQAFDSVWKVLLNIDEGEIE